MNKIFIVANWKSNKTESEATSWLEGFKIEDLGIENKEVVISPSFTLLPLLKSHVTNHISSISLGAQDISPFEEGAYTGEVNGRQIKEYAKYVIVGHSERILNLGEDEEIIKQKLDMAQKYELTPILCISDLKQIASYASPFSLAQGGDAKRYSLIVAYEPISAISTSGVGQADTPENAAEMAEKIKEVFGDIQVLYGGSVTALNVNSFTSKESISGVLVGNASLDPQEFAAIVTHA